MSTTGSPWNRCARRSGRPSRPSWLEGANRPGGERDESTTPVELDFQEGVCPMGEAYAHPEVLVSADWVEAHLKDPKVRIVESDEDILLYDLAHIPGAVRIDWQGDLQDQLRRDYIDAEKFAALCSRSGIANETTVVFYGDKSNWWACYAFWAFKLFGHADCRILNGGRQLLLDQKHPTTTEIPSYPPTEYTVRGSEE